MTVVRIKRDCAYNTNRIISIRFCALGNVDQVVTVAKIRLASERVWRHDDSDKTKPGCSLERDCGDYGADSIVLESRRKKGRIRQEKASTSPCSQTRRVCCAILPPFPLLSHFCISNTRTSSSDLSTHLHICLHSAKSGPTTALFESSSTFHFWIAKNVYWTFVCQVKARVEQKRKTAKKHAHIYNVCVFGIDRVRGREKKASSSHHWYTHA